MIHFEHVSKVFKKTPVLDDVNLDISPGERIALVGSNGAGKTTLIRCLLGEYVSDGTITVDGLSAREERKRVLQRIGFVPQLPPPLKMPVSDVIRFAAGTCDADPARMEAASATLGLDIPSVARQPFVKLSGGQKQKLLIGIALGRNCDVLIMDEPAANLDPDSRRAFFRLLSGLSPETVMLISSHRLDEVASLVNRVVELDRGKVVLDDRVADAVDLTGVLECVIELNRAEPALATSLTEWGFVDEGDGCRWRGSVPGPDRLRFLAMMSRYAGILSGLSLKEVRDEKGEAAQ
ncbi:MAG: ABC transporter ATP-binding protein [Rhodospirillaceae bacterium]|jgi:ABC-2 type transport system ATP-binding protein|nr:ABC transporter ATP-binding protein [Rhodospirillaceae bacterium]MBT4219205.1 ABC transporter ATP-binding protein [Rhodospirillaceae bacterium]MBT5014538.1 ABC transporter ATP-binding protein [Rhodospirillaceae bacterium]MBT5309266.1 ABC transporter ATP-binding protein [Rhodospirillaceae bacterium]MBT6405960.1 ABC transporter ATP-binding protein [Rhodospirillaceae bacterium]